MIPKCPVPADDTEADRIIEQSLLEEFEDDDREVNDDEEIPF